MTKFDDAKKKFSDMNDDDKVATVVIGLVALIVALGVLALVVMLIKELLVPALVGLAIYGGGVVFFNWPIPKVVKKLFK